MMKPFPLLDEAYSLILGEESQRSLQLHNHPQVGNSASAATVDTRRKSQSDPKCSHCGKTDHTREKCYRPIGFPPNFNFTKNKNSEQSSHAVVNQVNVDFAVLAEEETNFSSLSQLSLTKNQVQRLMTLPSEQNHHLTPSTTVTPTQSHPTPSTTTAPVQPQFAGTQYFINTCFTNYFSHPITSHKSIIIIHLKTLTL